jgi:hypothetical protein
MRPISLIAISFAALFGGSSLAAPADQVPNFSGMGFAWLAMGTDFKPVPGGPQPVNDDPAHPHVGNGQGKQSSFRVADINNPNLTDFAKESLTKTNEEVFRGKAVFSREARCWPTGVPTYDLNQAQPVYFVQTPKEVVMLWQMDHQVRHIYLDVAHSTNPQLSWYGESVGHYDGGDTLVVDTIGLAPKSFVDSYRTPHTDTLHVTERFKLIDGGKQMQIALNIDDPETFNQPWQATRTYRRMTGKLDEEICAENNQNLFDYHIPVSKTADF